MAAYRLAVSSALVVLLLFVFVPLSWAATWLIKPDGTGSAPTIQAGIDLAVPGDVVLLASGTFTGPGNVNLDFNGKAITVRSETGDPNDCIIDCQANGRGFYFQSGEGQSSILEGITIKNGAAYGVFPDYLGGGINCFQASPVIIRCLFKDCTGYVGGGASCYLSSATFTDCSFFGNVAGDGGGIYLQSNTPAMSGCVFAGNRAGIGGGMRCGGVTMTVTGCTFSNNSASGAAAGIYCEASTLSLDKTIVANNTGGAGLECGAGMTITLSCCDIFGNTGGDWVGCLAGMDGANGNFSENPMFCGPAADDYSLNMASFCAPANNPCGVVVGALPVACGSRLQCPGDEWFPVSAHVTFWELTGFVITNDTGTDLSFEYVLESGGPGTLVDNGDPASLSGKTPLLAPGQAYFPPPAAVQFPEINNYTEQTVTYVINESGSPGAADSCTTTLVFVPSVAVKINDFAATSLGAAVELTWNIHADEAIIGYNIYRTAGEDKEPVLVNRVGLIPAVKTSYLDSNVEGGNEYRYDLLVNTADGTAYRSPSVYVAVGANALELRQNCPNPFNPGTAISFVTPRHGPVELTVHSADGKLVKRLINGVVSAGTNEVYWDGTNNNGSRVGSGVYFYRLKSGDETITKKMVLLK